jgi:hypothetical protein
MHMQPAPKVKHFEPIEHNFMSNSFLNECFSSQPFLLKFQDFEFFVYFGFMKFI